MKPSQNKGKESQKNIGKGKDKLKQKNEEEEEPQGPPPEKPYNLERFIYITTYYDGNVMKALKELFEDINKNAFNLKSVKEIYTRGLSEEERDNNEIDYISGFQIIDKVLRITILEGITGKAIKKVKEKLPKLQMNSKTIMLFSDSKVLFNKRIYSKFDLSLKYIKLRENLSNILLTYDIYTKANKYRQIYDTFLNFGSILKAQTLKEITDANLIPEADNLLLLERKYGDILNDEDMTGVHKEKKKRQRIKLDSLSKTTASGFSGQSTSMKRSKGNDSFNESSAIQSSDEKNTKKKVTEEEKNKMNQTQQVDNKDNKFKKSVDARNLAFEEYLKEKKAKRTTSEDIWKRNIDYLKVMNKKKTMDKFCRLSFMNNSSHNIIMYGPSKANHYEEIMKTMRDKYINDKNHFYTYSNFGLTLNFPIIERDRNYAYLNYLENKAKWIVPNTDFERYKQPPREKYYFPKINNIL